MHRGNRCRTSVRDALFLEFTADRNAGSLWGTELRRSAIPPEIDREGALAPLLAARQKWLRAKEQKKKRRGSTWASSLEDAPCWL